MEEIEVSKEELAELDKLAVEAHKDFIEGKTIDIRDLIAEEKSKDVSRACAAKG
jgi:hypothetical protein